MAYTDYHFYHSEFHGNILTESTFCPAAERASDFMDRMTFDRITADILQEYEMKIKKCCCALAELIYQYQTSVNETEGIAKPVVQESIGSYSLTYASAANTISAMLDGESSGLWTYLQAICYEYLGNTGLLFRGV